MPAGLPAYVIDSFPESAFSGNLAAVVLLDGPRKPSWMQSVAGLALA